MHDNEASTTDKLVRNERRGVWFTLAVVLALASTLLMAGDTRRALLTALAVAIVFGVAWLTGLRTRNVRKRDQDVVMHDELRQAAMARAYRWAFLIVLAALAAFCLLGAMMVVQVTSPMLAALAVALGAVVFLTLFLLFDRA